VTFTIEQIMQHLPEAFVPEKAIGVKSNVQLDFGREGIYVVHIADGACEVTAGAIDQPDASMIASADTYIAIIEGRLEAMKAFMTGQLKVKGNLNLLLKFQSLFDPSRVQHS
jgi:putative sterol carrier protein